jgi:DMSO/TMAO reductase YedYZ molybdopterin-dependent catalytic subunit
MKKCSDHVTCSDIVVGGEQHMTISKEPEKGPYEFFESNPKEADKEFFGRETHADRRGFLKGAGLATMGAMVGSAIPFHQNMPAGFIPAAFASEDVLVGKDGLTLLNDRPVNAETPAHLLNDLITPTSRHFIRNNGIPPENVNPETWELTIDGLVKTPLKLSIADLKKNFKTHTLALAIECGGNGRSAFDPPAKGNQWTLGAVACSEWTGVKLKDVLEKAGVKSNAIYTAHEGADAHLSGKPGKLPISRGMPIEKAMTDNILIAWAQNGAPIHPNNGAPLRLVVPGWPGSLSHKWLNRIYLRDVEHDGPKMTGTAYRVPKYPVAPGTKVDKKDFEIIERMPVKSLITSHKTGSKIGKEIEVKGHAWSGDRKIKKVEISIDFGTTWQKVKLNDPINDGAWQNWSGKVKFPQAGYYEVWARATDDAGDQQPFALAWNPKGYLNNTLHRVALTVA